MADNKKAFKGGFRRAIGDTSLGPTLALALDNTTKQIHICDIEDVGTDWGKTNDSYPTVYIHDITAPITDYVRIYHNGTNGIIDCDGTTVLTMASTAWSSTLPLTLSYAGAALVVSSTWVTAGATGRPFAVNLTTNVSLGSYANAFKANVDLSSVGGATGLMSAGNFEITMPTTGIAGTTAGIEVEMTYGATCGALQKPCFFYLNTSGTAATDFDTYGDFFKLQGVTANAGKMLGAGSSTLRIGTGALAATKLYIPLSTAEGTYTSAYPVALTYSGTALDITNTVTQNIPALKITAAQVGSTNNLGMAWYADANYSGVMTATYVYGCGTWINLATSFDGAAVRGVVVAQDNGIYATTLTECATTDLVYGMRAECITQATVNGLYAFSLNAPAATTATHRAIFYSDNVESVGHAVGHLSGVACGHIGLAYVNGSGVSSVMYVNCWSS